MDLKVIKQYTDRTTKDKDIITVGTVLKNVKEDRAKELLAAGVVEEIKTETKKTAAEKKQ